MNPVEQEPQKTIHVGIGGAKCQRKPGEVSQVPGSTPFSAVLIRCQLTRWDRKLANDRQCEKN
jgi:hypothetical protein